MPVNIPEVRVDDSYWFWVASLLPSGRQQICDEARTDRHGRAGGVARLRPPARKLALVRLFDGEFALGAALLVVAAAMVILPQYFLDPGRILRGLAAGLLPRQLRGGQARESESRSGDAERDTPAAGDADDAAER